MESPFFTLSGEIVGPEMLVVPRARDIVQAITGGRLDYVRLIECRRVHEPDNPEYAETLVIEVDVERPQIVVNKIQRLERLAVALKPDDEWYPEVLSLRTDFPEVPHLNIGWKDDPRSLCLYDQSWDEVKARWTAPAFIERIRQWLADTAVGSLHREDQPLEQVLIGSGYRLVIPRSAIKKGGEGAVRLDVAITESSDHAGTFIARPASAEVKRAAKNQFIASLFIADPRQHGVIRHAPRTLEQLCDFVGGDGFDLLEQLRSRVTEWKAAGCLEASLIIIIVFPLQRGESAAVEVTDTWAFLTMQTVYEVGESIGVWKKTGGGLGVLIPPETSLRGSGVMLDVVRPHFTFTREAAARANGLEAVTTRTVAVGVGAIGSQVVMNLVRGGFGRWTIIDEDEFLPHNLARHALLPDAIGFSKAMVVGATISAFFEDEEPCPFIRANVLRPKGQRDRVNSVMADAELILDFSASVPVGRYLAHVEGSSARRASLFLNPLGCDLVLIGEDETRTARLDVLEAQYYRAVIRDPTLKGHLKANESRSRYARSCRDISFTLPTHLVGLHSSIGAQAVRAYHGSKNATIQVWHADPTTCAVTPIDVPIVAHFRASIGGWTVVMDQWLLDHLQQLRRERLPNETGGVLLGLYNLPQKTVYVVDTIHSPADSREKPTLYIRGCEGLAERVAVIADETAGEVQYVGEWHSHPDGCGVGPSTDDLNLFANITDRMTAAGYPAFMAIVGQHGQSTWFLGMMTAESGWSAP